MNRTEFLEHLSDVCEVKPETIENFKDSPDTLFNMACEWEGFIGFGESIKEWADGAFGSNICGVDYLNEAMEHSIRIGVDGIVTEIEPENGKDFQLDELYDLLGVSIIEMVFLPENLVMIVDEEGALHDDRKLNLKATELVTKAATKLGRMGTLIFGNVAVINQNQIK